MTNYHENQRIVGHAEDCLYDVWNLLPKDDERRKDIDKILIQLADLYHSFAIDAGTVVE